MEIPEISGCDDDGVCERKKKEERGYGRTS